MTEPTDPLVAHLVETGQTTLDPTPSGPAWLDEAIVAATRAFHDSWVGGGWLGPNREEQRGINAAIRAAAPHITRAALLETAAACDVLDVPQVAKWCRDRAEALGTVQTVPPPGIAPGDHHSYIPGRGIVCVHCGATVGVFADGPGWKCLMCETVAPVHGLVAGG